MDIQIAIVQHKQSYTLQLLYLFFNGAYICSVDPEIELAVDALNETAESLSNYHNVKTTHIVFNRSEHLNSEDLHKALHTSGKLIKLVDGIREFMFEYVTVDEHGNHHIKTASYLGVDQNDAIRQLTDHYNQSTSENLDFIQEYDEETETTSYHIDDDCDCDCDECSI